MDHSYDNTVPWTSAATWLSEGPLLCPPEAFVQWFYQSTTQILTYFARQVSKDIRIRVDPDKLREAIVGMHDNQEIVCISI